MDRLAKVLSDLQETLGAPSPQGSGWTGYAAPLGNLDYKAGPQPFPYRTQTAERIWAKAKELVPKHPELDEPNILRKAFEETGLDARDLTPEDWRLLEMAIEFFKNGTIGIPKPRIGGMPGGPANHHRDGHYLAKRGAP
jgi:hypothetical protein